MNSFNIISILVILALSLVPATAFCQGHDVVLHVNPRWEECSFQLDPSLTQDEWRQFTQEAGLVAYFRPLTDARTAGVGNFEVSLLQWGTGIDDEAGAWNNTFVHPDSNHWLTEGSRLAFPGLMVRTGIADNMDVAGYFTKNVNANYGFYGAQFRYNFLNDTATGWAASARLSGVAMYGPDDLGLNVLGIDALASREFALDGEWLSLSPYAGVSTYLSNSHETTDAVNLADEHVAGVQGMVGAVARVSVARLAVEYNVAKVNTLSFRLGVMF